MDILSPRSWLISMAAVAAPSVPPATTFVWGPPVVDLFGAKIQVVSMALSLFGLAMARGVASAREGNKGGGWYLTGTLATILIGLVIERQPTPGIAVGWGVGIGLSGLVLVDLLKDRAIALIRGTPPTASRPLETERETE